MSLYQEAADRGYPYHDDFYLNNADGLHRHRFVRHKDRPGEAGLILAYKRSLGATRLISYHELAVKERLDGTTAVTGEAADVLGQERVLLAQGRFVEQRYDNSNGTKTTIFYSEKAPEALAA